MEKSFILCESEQNQTQDVEHSELAWLVVWGDHCSDCIMVNVVNGPFIPSDAPKFLTVHSTGSVLTLLSLSATPVCVHPGPGPPACVRTGEEGGVPRGGGKPHSCHQVVQERLRSERGHHSGIRTFLCREIKEKIWIFLLNNSLKLLLWAYQDVLQHFLTITQ